MKLFLGFHPKGAKNNQKFSGTSDFLRIFDKKTEAKRKCCTFLIFSLWFWVGALVKFVLL